MPSDSKDFVLVIHEYELAFRGAMSRALNLSTQKVVVAFIKKLGSTAL
jgi:hypothetical protein